ncbi:hypothetical protein [Amycolatopsis thailandensis]|uniref:hypothetical protein n=1 Tax=Amycolatopsis thailandensis TaxID=589330 RepID=UPI00362FF21E
MTVEDRRDPVVLAVSTMVGTVVGLTFLFGLATSSRSHSGSEAGMGAPLVAPAVDLTVVALLVATRRRSRPRRSISRPSRKLDPDEVAELRAMLPPAIPKPNPENKKTTTSGLIRKVTCARQ